LPQREGVDFGVIDRKLAVAGQVLRLTGADGPIDEIFLPLYGAHQAANAAQAHMESRTRFNMESPLLDRAASSPFTL